MSEPNRKGSERGPRYRLIAVNKDGREIVLAIGMSLEEAQRAQPGIDALGEYASTRIEPEPDPRPKPR